MTRKALVRTLRTSLVVLFATVVLVGCGDKPRKKKPTKEKLIPSEEDLVAHLNKLRTTDANMVSVPAGRYKLGDNSFKGNRERTFELEAGFKMDIYEVSNLDWFLYLWINKETNATAYMAAPPTIMGDYATDGWVAGDKDFQFDHEKRKQHPVRAIHFDEANGYAKFFLKQLPTADEWECAARGEDGLRYPWGDTYKRADWKTRAWTSFNVALDETGHAKTASIQRLHDTVAVNSMPGGKSPFGVFHMADNVSEWTTSETYTRQDQYKKLPRAERPRAKIVKGGSFFSRQKGTLSAQFFDLIPSTATDVFRVGFRCIRRK